MEKRHRIFIAINLPEGIKKQLFKYSEKWPELPARWTPKDNLHITLEFLGYLTNQEIVEVCDIVSKVSERHHSFSVNLNGISYGPTNLKPNQLPKMVWVSGEKSLGRSPTGELKELSELKTDLQNSLLEKIRFRAEHKVFAPHITLARISSFAFRQIELEERPQINENIDLVFTAESIDVMESELHRGGPQYMVLESHQLK